MTSNKIETGEKLFAGGNHTEAIQVFCEVLEHDPANKEAYNNLGVIAFNMGEFDTAGHLLTKCLSIDPFYKEGIINFFMLLGSKKRSRETVPTLKKYLERYPEDDEVKLLLQGTSNSEMRAPGSEWFCDKKENGLC